MSHATTMERRESVQIDEAVLIVDGLSVEFTTERGRVRVLDDVSLRLEAGKTLGLVGESGSGKTVTSLAVMGLLDERVSRIAGGSIRYRGKELIGQSRSEWQAIRGQEIAMIFQEGRRSLDPVFTVGEQIAEAVRQHEGLNRKQAWNRAVEMLELVEIREPHRRAHEYPHTFSGGMCQRVMLASALASNPAVLIADEPTTALDVTVQAQVLDLLRRLQAELGLAIMFVSHDLGVVAEMCDRVAVMYAGQVVEESETVGLYCSPTHPYTEGLLGAMPESAVGKQRLLSIPGTVPPPHAWPAGCHFSDRCRHSEDKCRDGKVPLVRESDHAVRCARYGEITLEGIR